jgi:organic hydroperoxide reductase OsmC/OhrA
MSHPGHQARVRWERGTQAFNDNRYSRAHVWTFDGGAQVPASASPANVPAGSADPLAVDPEEGFIAALASCHMLWFLSIAASHGFVVDSYEDRAEGFITPLADAPDRKVLGRVVLRPAVTFAPASPCSEAQLSGLHEEAHRACFLANALGPRCSLLIEPRAPSVAPR